MSEFNQTTLTGEVTDVFAHRFVVRTERGKVLADLGPKGGQQITVLEGDRVTISGEMKHLELKVHAIQKGSGPTISLERKKPHHHPNEQEVADPKRAVKTVERNGFFVVAPPRRKPKHFEILGRDAAGDFVEFHVELDGALRKTRPATYDDPKWADDMRNYS